MIAYVDASVLLRVALGQPNALPDWRQIERGVSSALITTESLRTLIVYGCARKLSDIEVARRRSTILALLDSWNWSRSTRSCSSALHSRCRPKWAPGCDSLASALLWRDAMESI